MNLSALATDHPYYASEINYFTNEFPAKWDTVDEFLQEFETADIGLNLVYRWDVLPIHEDELMESGPVLGYWVQVVFIHQRKGIYAPHWIKQIEEQDVPRFVAFLRRHWEQMREIWEPLSD